MRWVADNTNMAIKIQQVILHALQIGFCIKCVAHMDDDLQVRMQVPLFMHKASLVLPTINCMHERQAKNWQHKAFTNFSYFDPQS